MTGSLNFNDCIDLTMLATAGSNLMAEKKNTPIMTNISEIGIPRFNKNTIKITKVVTPNSSRISLGI